MSYANTPSGKNFVLIATSGTYVKSAAGADDAALQTTLALTAGALVRDMVVNKYVLDTAEPKLVKQVLRKVKYTASTGVYNTFYIDVTGPSSNWASLNA